MNNQTNLKYWIALNSLEKVSTKLSHSLIEHFGSPEKIFSSSKDELKSVEGMTPVALKAVTEFKHLEWAEKELQMARDLGVSLIHWGSQEYPKSLAQIYDPPVLMYVKGSLIETDKSAIAMVGSRKATSYGIKAANKFASALTKHKVTLVSGMARGIDTEVHRTTLRNDGRTIAVLGSGLEFIYPPENRGLYAEIIKHGAVISEFPLLSPPKKHHFPRRNRIISGLSLGTIVVEASERSGSLITARFALEQGREVFAIPGSVGGETSKGVHRLIQDGAKLVQNVDDIMNELQIPIRANRTLQNPVLSEVETWILTALDDEPLSADHLIQNSAHSARKVSAALTDLELKGFVRQIHGNRYLKEA